MSEIILKHRRTSRVLSSLLTILFLLAFVASENVVEASAAPAKSSGFKPASSVLFNDPHGSRSQEYAIINELRRFINAAPRGSKIRLAYYWLGITAVTDDLIRADERCVEVDVLLDKKHVKERAAQKLLKALKNGGKCKSKKSSATYRKDLRWPMHVKLFLASTSGKSKRIAGWGSANASVANAESNYNDFRFRVNAPNYTCLQKQFDRLANPKIKIKEMLTAGPICQNKGLVTQFTPAKGANPWITLGTGHITCSPGTAVRAVVMQWSDTAVAKAFLAKQAQGCDVQLLVNKSLIRKSVLSILKQKTKHHGRIKIFFTTTKVHNKWMAVQGGKQAWTLTGSLHPMKGSQAGIQLVVREDGKTLASKYVSQFKKLTSKKHAKCYSGCKA